MIVDAGFLTEWSIKGHAYGQCLIHPAADLIYVNVPKNASSWTKPNLLEHGWIEKNYHDDNLYDRPALVVLRDPVDRWLSGIAEYLALYHSGFQPRDWNSNVFDLIFERVCFDDHTEMQVKFLHGLDTENCTFILCDDQYSHRFGEFIMCYHGPNKYDRYRRQHVSEQDPVRKQFKKLFENTINESKYLTLIQNYYEKDYDLINTVKFYEPR